MDDDLEKMAKKLRTFSHEMVQNPYWGIPTFFGVPYQQELINLDIALIGVPFDLGVTNRGRARMGPRELRNQSRMVGAYNHHTCSTPCATHRIADVGDVPFRTVYYLEEALEDIVEFYRNLSSAGIVPVTAGGDHSITYPILKGMAPKEKLGLIHFDSHCDTAPPIHGSGFAHGSPMRNAVESGLVDPERTIQIGIRGSSELLWQFSYDNNMRVMHIEEFYELGWKNVVREIRTLMGDAPAYVSFDIDCLDPAFAPGTGTPVAGGMSTFEVLQTLRGLKGLNIIGGDLVEVSPPYDSAGITALAGATILFEILCLAAGSPSGT
ncbi:MAG: agmatinase [Methanoregula sp.]|nr:agmatinase [Methanoregula sp.]